MLRDHCNPAPLHPAPPRDRLALTAEDMAALGRIAAGIAHEIGNPLTFISCNLHCMETYAKNLLQAVEASPGALGEAELAFLRTDIPALFAESVSGMRRITDIVQQLRSFAQPDRPEPWNPVALDALADSAWQRLAGDAGPGVRLVREAGALPLIRCQVGQFSQVFDQLLSNAIQAVGDKGTIWLTSGCTPHGVWFEVADDGCGIAPEHRDHIFEAFFTTRAVGRGMGLGLFSAYGIIGRHGGSLSVANRVGGGCVFRIELPAALVATESAPVS